MDYVQMSLIPFATFLKHKVTFSNISSHLIHLDRFKYHQVLCLSL